jgi:hypothetical protein
MSYKILDDGLCYDKNIPTATQAMSNAEEMINTIPFGELGTIQIVNEITGDIEFTFNPVITWG